MDFFTLVFVSAMLGVAGVFVLAVIEFISPDLVNKWLNKTTKILKRG